MRSRSSTVPDRPAHFGHLSLHPLHCAHLHALDVCAAAAAWPALPRADATCPLRVQNHPLLAGLWLNTLEMTCAFHAEVFVSNRHIKTLPAAALPSFMCPCTAVSQMVSFRKTTMPVSVPPTHFASVPCYGSIFLQYPRCLFLPAPLERPLHDPTCTSQSNRNFLHESLRTDLARAAAGRLGAL